jgi:hypothetical protein
LLAPVRICRRFALSSSNDVCRLGYGAATIGLFSWVSLLDFSKSRGPGNDRERTLAL